MSYSLIPTPNFERELKALSKKYKSIKSDFSNLVNALSENPFEGDFWGKSCYKVRMAISDKNKGKSAGARVIVHVKIVDRKVYLLSIYDKSQKADLFPGELDVLIPDE